MGQDGSESAANGYATARSRSLNNRSRASAGANFTGAAVRALPVLPLAAIALIAPVVLRGLTVSAPTLRAAIEMMMTLFALAGAWLLRAQFGSSRRLGDLMLVAGALALGLIELGAGALPAALDLSDGTYFAAARLFGLLVVAAMFAVSAFGSPGWLVARRRHPVAITAGLGVAGLAIAGLGGLLGGTHHARSLAANVGHPRLLVLVVAVTGMLLYAGAGFARRHFVESDRVAGLMAIAMVLMAGVGFSNAVSGSLSPGQIGTSEGLRALACALVLAAAVVADRRVDARMSKATALAERRRVARDLHDGIAQDLAFIAAHGPRFAQELGDEHPMVIAARRALAISRLTISELSNPVGATAREALDAIARELGDRFDIAIAVNAQLDRDLEAQEREHVTRIAREAIANAARHGGARNVIVSLKHTDTGTALRVVDDGRGIAAADQALATEGFGLRSMRERAAALGGQLHVRQPRRGGTELEVILP
jgi:signal transduction histidine kinase